MSDDLQQDPPECFSSFYIEGVVAKVCGLPRAPPSVYDGIEIVEWLEGYDA